MPESKLKIFIEQSARLDQLDALHALFGDFLHANNISYCSIKFLREFQDKIYMAPIYQSLPSYPFKPEQQYDLMFHSSLGQRHIEARKPFFWDNSVFEQEEPNYPLRKYLFDQGLDGGFCVPVFHGYSTKSIASFLFNNTGSRQQLAFRLQTCVLYFLNDVMRINAMPVNLKGYKAGTRAALSSRETEILTWIALGKSSWETATILGISEHTVNGHIENAVRKLDAKNRTEAVAIALLTHQVNLRTQARH